jgi:Protein kinase domain/GAF domain
MPAVLQTIAAVAAVKIVVAAVSLAVGWTSGTAGTYLPLWMSVALVATYASAGAALVVGGQRDVRTVELGTWLLLIAAPFSDVLARSGDPLGGVALATTRDLRPEALIPAVVWLFVRDFPIRVPLGTAYRLLTRVARACAIVGIALWAINIALFLGADAPNSPLRPWLIEFSRREGHLYWLIVCGLALPAGPLLVARGRGVPPGERRRVLFFVVSVGVGLLPISVDVLLQMTGGLWGGALSRPASDRGVMSLVVAMTLLVPFALAYSVLVARVVDLRLIVRAALQYALARVSLVAAAALPAAWLVWLLYRNRHLTVQQLVFGRAAFFVFLASILGLAAMYLRPRLTAALDRRFFREEYDAQRLLTALADASRTAESTEAFAGRIADEIDEALHLDRVAVLVREEHANRLVDPEHRARPLSCASTLAVLLGTSDDPLDLEPHNPWSGLRRLGESDREWIADGGYRLLVPLRTTEGTLTGLIALGEKRSELPFSARERELLTAVGTSGGLFLENRLLPARSSTSVPGVGVASADDKAALECSTCGVVFPPMATACACGARLVEAAVPKMLAGKFQLERRVGAGGMAVVYRASDLTLGRTVAIKTLPRVDFDQTWRLRREARAMALVRHENLALIFGAESWHGRPMLIEEFLPGGTLADRIRKGPLPRDEALRIGIVLTRVVGALHEAGLLHRDLKPSNVGFTDAGVPKLLDFGLAQLLMAEPSEPVDREASSDATTKAPGAAWVATQHGVGTPAYMSPEALARETPSPGFDLWSLAVLLFEAFAGVNPFRGETVLDTIGRVENLKELDLRVYMRGCSAELAAFFRTALARDRQQRPATADDFRRRLELLLAERVSV